MVSETQTRKDLRVELPGDVRERLDADARDRGASINTVAVGILAAHFFVPFEGSGRRSQGARTSGPGVLILTMPKDLHRKIREAAYDLPNHSVVVESVLRAHYGLGVAAVAA